MECVETGIKGFERPSILVTGEPPALIERDAIPSDRDDRLNKRAVRLTSLLSGTEWTILPFDVDSLGDACSARWITFSINIMMG
jgi:hypothetical protein